jgi:hypothetical protein
MFQFDLRSSQYRKKSIILLSKNNDDRYLQSIHLKFDRKESKGEVLPRLAAGVLANDGTIVSWKFTRHLKSPRKVRKNTTGMITIERGSLTMCFGDGVAKSSRFRNQIARKGTNRKTDTSHHLSQNSASTELALNFQTLPVKNKKMYIAKNT